MLQENFSMMPCTKESFEKEAVVSEAAQSDAQESQEAESKILTGQRSIDDIKKDILDHWHQAEQSYLEVGRLLLEARKQVTHGSWLQWLNDNTEISAVKAQRLMRIAEEYGANTSPVMHLGFSKASVLLTLPKDERESFVKEAHDVGGNKKNVSDMSKRELENVVREYKKTRSHNKFDEQSDSDRRQNPDYSANGKSVDWATEDPLTYLSTKVFDFGNIVDDVLNMLLNQVNDTDEQDILIHNLRSICKKALEELPPDKPVAETLSA